VQYGQQLFVLLHQTRTLNGKTFMLLREHNPASSAAQGSVLFSGMDREPQFIPSVNRSRILFTT